MNRIILKFILGSFAYAVQLKSYVTSIYSGMNEAEFKQALKEVFDKNSKDDVLDLDGFKHFTLYSMLAYDEDK